MSVSYNTYVVFGLDLNDAVEKHTIKKTITRYNEKTGEPYEVNRDEVKFCITRSDNVVLSDEYVSMLQETIDMDTDIDVVYPSEYTDQYLIGHVVKLDTCDTRSFNYEDIIRNCEGARQNIAKYLRVSSVAIRMYVVSSIN